MNRPLSVLDFLRNPQLATHALAAFPVWLWTTDGARIAWANPSAAAIANAGRPASATPAGEQIVRLAGSLRHGGAPRLERLRNLAPGFGRILTCACSRVAIGNDTFILVVATEPAGPGLPLSERARRLIADDSEALAIYSQEGTLVHATAAAESFLNGATSLHALGAAPLAAETLQTGRAAADFPSGRLTLHRIGTGDDTLLLAGFAARPAHQVDLSPIAQAMARTARSYSAQAQDEISSSPPAEHPERDALANERRHPLRFVWQMDGDGHFTLGSDEFMRLIGPTVAASMGRRWTEIANALQLDPEGQIAKAIASRDTWSGITVAWPVEGSDERLDVELSGLPILDRDRTFRGYRGFGVCRDTARLATLAKANPPAQDDEPLPSPRPDYDSSIGNVVPFRGSSESKPSGLNAVEHKTFHELARQLSERLQADQQDANGANGPAAPAQPEAAPPGSSSAVNNRQERSILDHLPVGVLVYRTDELLYANRTWLTWTGCHDLTAFAEAGGLDTLLLSDKVESGDADAKRLILTTSSGAEMPIDTRIHGVSWEDQPASMLIASAALSSPQADARPAANPPTSLVETQSHDAELRAALELAADGVVTFDRNGLILGFNHAAETLFGGDASALPGRTVFDLLAPESRAAAREDLDQLAQDIALRSREGREVIGRLQGGPAPLFMTIGRVAENSKFCAAFHGITRWKRAEEELIEARRQVERAFSAKSEFLAKISHEIRAPLNVIIGFSEVMAQERFGPVGNERYLGYAKDIHTSGQQVVDLLNDLLDLSRIETGKMDLHFAGIDLNDITQQCVAQMQPQANRERIIIRTSLPPSIPPVIADAESVRQIVLNLLSNSIKFTRAGGQVIVSTTLNEQGEVALRIRDTGVGMSEKDIEAALEPFRQLTTSLRTNVNGADLGLPLTKALAEANRAHFQIKSAIDDGTLVEVSFPRARAAAE